MQRFALLIAFAATAIAQNTAVFPTRVATNQDLLIGSNLFQTTLSAAAQANDTTLTLMSVTGLKLPGVLTIDSEIIQGCSLSGFVVSICTNGRGFDGTTAAVHNSGARVSALVIAWHHNQLAAEVIALETWTQTHGGGGGGGTWGSITGTLSSQADLAAALAAKQTTITLGSTGQYFRGDLSLASFPTIPTIATGPLKGSGGNAVSMTYADLVALWSGCSGTMYLGFDGTCHSAAGSGTVTSVGITPPSWLAASAAITTSGSISLTPTSGQASHQFLATCGSSTTFAPCLPVPADFPTLNQNTTGNAATATALASSIFTLYQTSLPQPSTPTITQGGTPASKTYFYSIVPLNAFGFGLAAPYATTTTGATTLSATNYNIVTTASVTGSTSCDVFRSTLNGGVPSGNWIFVGNVACGSAFNDQTNSPNLISTYGEGGNGLVDESTGLLMTKNMAVNGSLAVGGPVPGGGNAQQTSGIAQMSVSQTVQGSVAPISDPVLLALNMTIDPSGLGVNQPWMLQGLMKVPSTNGSTIPSLEGLSINITDNGTGVLQQADGGLFQVSVGSGLTSSGVATTTDQITGVRSFGFVQSAIPTYSGYSSQISLSGSGTLSRLSMYRASNLLLGSTPVTTFHVFDTDAPLSGSVVTDYATYYAPDTHATGTNSSYQFRGVGTSSKSKLDGTLEAGVLQADTSLQLAGGPVVTAVQGTDTKLLSAGTITSTSGLPLCLDGNSGATTSGCPSSIPSGASPQVPIYASSGTTLTPWQNVYRFASDQSVTSSTTLTNSTGAVIALASGQTYFFDAWIYATANNTGGIKITPAYQGTLSASSDAYEVYTNTSTPAAQDVGWSFSGFNSPSYTGAGTQFVIHFHGTITTTSAANFQFQFAQNTSNAAATTLKANSTVHIWPSN